jgi:hypothetical protein
MDGSENKNEKEAEQDQAPSAKIAARHAKSTGCIKYWSISNFS